MALPPVWRCYRKKRNAYSKSSYNSASRPLSSFTRMALRSKRLGARRRLKGLNMRINSSKHFTTTTYYGSVLLALQGTGMFGPHKKQIPLPVLSPNRWCATAKRDGLRNERRNFRNNIFNIYTSNLSRCIRRHEVHPRENRLFCLENRQMRSMIEAQIANKDTKAMTAATGQAHLAKSVAHRRHLRRAHSWNWLYSCNSDLG